MNKPTALILSCLLVASSAQAIDAPSAPSVSLTQPTSEPRKPARKPDILYVPTPEKVVEEMLAMTKVGKDDVVYDLGCGDGRIVINAAKKYGARGVGIDIDPQRIREAQENATAAGVQDRVKFSEEDLFQSDLKDASVVSLYLLTSLNRKLRPKLFAETRPGTRVVSHAFAMGEWEPDEHKVVEGSNVFFWVVPANISGEWTVNGQGKPRVDSVTIDQSFQKFTGTVKANGETRKITNGRLTGDKFTFTVEATDGAGQPMTLTGQIKGDTIEASTDGEPKSTWTAQRDPTTKRQLAAAP